MKIEEKSTLTKESIDIQREMTSASETFEFESISVRRIVVAIF